MLESFLWWIGGCLTTWFAIKKWEMRIAQKEFRDYVLKSLLITYNVYMNLRNGVLFEAKLRDKEVYYGAIDDWAESIVKSILVICKKNGEKLYQPNFKNWSDVLILIENYKKGGKNEI